ncbi:uncharacterized protein LOC102360671 [Latimeria chalumnae]
MAKKKLLLLLLILLFGSEAEGGSHSLQYFYTSTEGAEGFPEFEMVGFVDDVQIVYFDSQEGKANHKQQWLEKIVRDEDPSYWERITQTLSGDENMYKTSVTNVMKRFNQNSGVHTLQEMYGCELRDDGTTGGFDEFAYDGQDFISFDKETQTWTTPVQQAVITKHKWDANRASNQILKGYLEQECIEWLKKYIHYGKEMLERKVQPQVKLSHRPGSERNSIVLTCMVTGFHPRAIDVTWIRDGETQMDNAHTDGILPNEDGTYQIKKTIEIGSDDKSRYACEVEHGSLNPKLNVVWVPPSGSNMVIIIAVVIVVLVLVAAAIVGFVMWKKKNGGYSQAQTKESSSDTSSDTTPPKVYSASIPSPSGPNMVIIIAVVIVVVVLVAAAIVGFVIWKKSRGSVIHGAQEQYSLIGPTPTRYPVPLMTALPRLLTGTHCNLHRRLSVPATDLPTASEKGKERRRKEVEDVKMLFVLLLSVLCALGVGAEPHTLRYLYLGTMNVKDFPEFLTVGLVDNVRIRYFDSVTGHCLSSQKWMEAFVEKEDPEYWESMNRRLKSRHQNFKENIQILRRRYNQTNGAHSLQWTHGCTLGETGESVSGFMRFGYDGEDFISFNMEGLNWVAAKQEAKITKDKWDKDQALNHQTKGYLQDECIHWLKKYLEYGNGDLGRKVHPEVQIYNRPGPWKNSISLTCMVTGFYPQSISVNWIKNGEVFQVSSSDNVLPNEDETYQLRNTIEIDPEDEGSYACHVEHSSLEEKRIVSWEKETGLNTGIIVAVVIVVLLLVLAGVGFMIWKKVSPLFNRGAAQGPRPHIYRLPSPQSSVVVPVTDPSEQATETYTLLTENNEESHSDSGKGFSKGSIGDSGKGSISGSSKVSMESLIAEGKNNDSSEHLENQADGTDWSEAAPPV